MTKKRKLTAAEVNALHAKLMAKADAVVEKSVDKIALRPPQSSLDGTMLTVLKDEVGLHLGAVDMSSVNVGFKIVLPSGLGLQTRHLVASLRGPCGESFAIIVNMLLTAEMCGTGVIQALRNDIADMLDLFIGDLLTRMRAEVE